MKKIFLQLAFIWSIWQTAYAQTYTHPTTGIGGTYVGACMVNTCGGTYYDDGGAAGNYANNTNNIYRVFCPSTPGTAVSITFNTFSLETAGIFGCPDYLVVISGATQNPQNPSDELFNGCGTSAQGRTYTSTDPSGCLSIRFVSDLTVRGVGWAATLNCVPFAGGPSATDNTDCVNAQGICDNASSFSGDSDGPGLVSESCTGCTAVG
jgi:hypothetical protein